MVTQGMVDEHAARIDELVAVFQAQVSIEVEAIVTTVTAHLLRTLEVRRGVIEQTSLNSAEIRMVDDVFAKALKSSSYYQVIQIFVSEFSTQVDEFKVMYEEMKKGTSLPGLFFVDDDRAILTAQAGASLSAIESLSLQVTYDLRQLSSRYLGGVEMADLVQGVSEAIRKLAKVGPLAKDQLIVFFRLIGSLFYRNLENAGYAVVYTYVGPMDDKNRAFCSALISGGPFSRNQIDAMDNGQVAGVFENAGGFGCRHWWEVGEK